MKSKAYLLCDASFESTLRIGVAAFSLVINGVRTRKTIRLSNITSSHEAEFCAINEGLKELKSQTSSFRGNGKPIGQLHIFTDSQDVIQKTSKGRFSDIFPQNDPYYTLISTYRSLGASISDRFALHKVKSHVPDELASNIEKSHNLVDKMARGELHAYREEIVNPNIENTKTAAIILSKKVHKKDRNNIFKLGYNLASHGYHIRFFDEQRKSYDSEKDLTVHPLLDGIKHYCKKHGTYFYDITTEVKIKPKTGSITDSNVLTEGCFGLDSCLLQISKGQTPLKQQDLISNSALYHGALSRLIYGIQIKPRKFKQNHRKTLDRSGKPAEFVLNLKNESSRFDEPIKSAEQIIGYPFYSDYASLIEDKPHLNKRNSSQKDITHDL